MTLICGGGMCVSDDNVVGVGCVRVTIMWWLWDV